jgi:hypothetical protein
MGSFIFDQGAQSGPGIGVRLRGSVLVFRVE